MIEQVICGFCHKKFKPIEEIITWCVECRVDHPTCQKCYEIGIKEGMFEEFNEAKLV